MAGANTGANKEAESTPQTTGASAPSSDNKSSLITLILSVVNILVTVGMLGILFVSFQKEKNKPSIDDISSHGEGGEKEKGKEEGKGGEHGGGGGGEHGEKKESEYGKMIALDQFTINLSTPGSATPKFVRANISLEVPSEDIETEVVAKMPQIRNTIIDLFNSKRPVDLVNAEGRDYLKEEVRNAINSFLLSGKIKGVYFTNFAVAG